MANLRRGFSPATEHYVWPYLARFCSLENEHERMVFATVAACFGFHPEHTDEGNFGTTLNRVACSRQGAENPLEAFEPRFRRILSASTVQDICQQLRSLVQLAKGSNVPINYVQLLNDLLCWEQNSREIKIQWAASYYAGSGRAAEEAPAEESVAKVTVSDTSA